MKEKNINKILRYLHRVKELEALKVLFIFFA